MRTCRHLEAFDISVAVNDPSKAGLPPWMALCENCAADVVDALRAQVKAIVDRHPSGKSSSAVRAAHYKRVLNDLLGWRLQWRPNDPAVVEQFKERLGGDYFNHGGLLRLHKEPYTELQDGDWLIYEEDGQFRVQTAPKLPR
jgi:hypothetical protein